MSLGYELQPDAGAVWTTFSPTVTLVGGAGNTVPVYTINEGRWRQVGLAGQGGQVFVQVRLDGDGGNEGAGSGVINIAIPVAAGANVTTLDFMCGQSLNSATFNNLTGLLSSGATTVRLDRYSAATTLATMTGAQQNNSGRYISLHFNYEI